MTQSAITVTPPNPSPPTNFASTGVTGPNPPNYTRQQYANMGDMTAVAADGSGGRPDQTTPGVGVNPNPPPYYDDGSALTVTAFAASVAALTGGTSAADNNTGTTPGTNAAGAGGDGFNSASGSYPGVANGLVPAAASATAEGLGTETVFTKVAGAVNDFGSDLTKYGPTIYAPVPLVTVGSGPAASAASRLAGPNASHPSSLSPATNPTLTTIAPTTAVSGASGTVALTAVTGVGFTPQSVVYANGVPIPTVFVSSTTLTATMPKKTSAGTWPITVVTGGVVVTAPQTFTWT